VNLLGQDMILETVMKNHDIVEGNGAANERRHGLSGVFIGLQKDGTAATGLLGPGRLREWAQSRVEDVKPITGSIDPAGLEP